MGRHGKEEGSIDKDGEKRYQLEVVVMDYECLLSKHVAVANTFVHLFHSDSLNTGNRACVCGTKTRTA